MRMIKNHLTRGLLSASMLLIMLMWSSISHTKTLKVVNNSVHATGAHKKSIKNSPYKKGVTGHYKATGLASWYGYESGKITALGTKFNPKGLSAAHRTLALPTKVKVTNLKNNKSVILTVNDRGPYEKGRLIDLSQEAARVIGITGVGTVTVESI